VSLGNNSKWAEENHDKPHSGESVRRPRTSSTRIQIHWAIVVLKYDCMDSGGEFSLFTDTLSNVKIMWRRLRWWQLMITYEEEKRWSLL